MTRDSRVGAKSAAPARFLLRLPPTLRAALLVRARAAGLSLNEHINRRLAAPEPNPTTEVLGPVLFAAGRRVAGADVMGVIVHGSWARGEARTSSDIDALVVVDDARPLTRALYRKWDEQPVIWEGRTVDVHFAHLPRGVDHASSLWCEAAVEGRLMADPSGRVEDMLVQIRRAIADRRFVRSRAHGQPYWRTAA
jgi:predicted nucleotidyltransferase